MCWEVRTFNVVDSQVGVHNPPSTDESDPDRLKLKPEHALAHTKHAKWSTQTLKQPSDLHQPFCARQHCARHTAATQSATTLLQPQIVNP